MDGFLLELMAAGADHEEIARLCDVLEPMDPPATLRERVLAEVEAGGRLHRFADTVAEMLDVSIERARELLDGIDDKSVWKKGPSEDVTLYDVPGGARTEGSITGFVRVARGGLFPEHDHLGEEHVLIVQGRCIDSYDGRRLGPGDTTHKTPGSPHHIEVLPGPALVFLTVVREGVEIGGKAVRPS
jgi:quercetin dioxygenase-like cupin family protein